jgi:hypothetical protein
MKTAQVPTSKNKKTGEAPAGVSRRSFLNVLWAALGLAALAEFLWLAFSFLWPAKPGGESQANTVVPAGSLASFEPGTVTGLKRRRSSFAPATPRPSTSQGM